MICRLGHDLAGQPQSMDDTTNADLPTLPDHIDRGTSWIDSVCWAWARSKHHRTDHQASRNLNGLRSTQASKRPPEISRSKNYPSQALRSAPSSLPPIYLHMSSNLNPMIEAPRTQPLRSYVNRLQIRSRSFQRLLMTSNNVGDLLLITQIISSKDYKPAFQGPDQPHPILEVPNTRGRIGWSQPWF